MILSISHIIQVMASYAIVAQGLLLNLEMVVVDGTFMKHAAMAIVKILVLNQNWCKRTCIVQIT